MTRLIVYGIIIYQLKYLKHENFNGFVNKGYVKMWLSDSWKDYEAIDCGDGEKLERWGKYHLVRPDPQAIWTSRRTHPKWNDFDAKYHRSSKGGGYWENRSLPSSWTIKYNNLSFMIKPMNFKHTGLFPEQAANWDFIERMISRANRPVNILNLFAYTGGATIAAAAAGASVCHVDAARGMVNQARENAALSGLEDAPIRWIVDDCVKFVEREIRRGKSYDAIIMDPPSYGRGPTGETWKLEEKLFGFIKLCRDVLSPNPLFVIINSYTTGLSPSVMHYMSELIFTEKYGGSTEYSELGIPVTETALPLPAGSTARWVSNI